MARTRTILLLSGDYDTRLDTLAAAAIAARADESATTLLDDSPYEALREEYEALKVEAEAAAAKVVIRSISRSAWQRLKADHPPRTDGPEDSVKADRVTGVNVDTVEDDLVYASLVEPEFQTRAAFDEWAGDLAAGDFQAILLQAWELTNGSRRDPKSLPVSPIPSSDRN